MRKKLLKILSPILAVLIILSGIIIDLNFSTKVYAKEGYVSFTVGTNQEKLAQVKSNATPYATPKLLQVSSTLYQWSYSGLASIKLSTTNSSIKVSNWDSTHWFSLTPQGLGTLTTKLAYGNSINASNATYSLGWSTTPINAEFNELGGLDLVITITQKSDISSIPFSFNADNIVGYLQTPLTDEEMANGSSRPDYVDNSIALYATDAGGMVTDLQAAAGLTTGKIGQLYRMKVIGKDGTWAWMDWSIVSDGNYQLNDTTGYIKAQPSSNYPMTISPVGDTFGYQTGGKTGYFGYSGYIYAGSQPYMGAAGTLTSLTGYLQYDGTYYVQFGMYDTNSPANLVGGSASVTNSGTWAWKTGAVASTPTISAINYVFGLNYQSGAQGVGYDTGGANGKYLYKASVTFGTWPATVTFGTSNPTGYLISIYGTYTPGGGTADFTNTGGTSINLGTLAQSSTYYAKGSAPANPVATTDCTWYITNTSAAAEDYTMKATNWTGGVGWTLSGSVGSNQVKVTAYYAGENPASGLVLTTSAQAFYSNLAASATKYWDFRIDTGTFTDGTAKSSVITITATLH